MNKIFSTVFLILTLSIFTQCGPMNAGQECITELSGLYKSILGALKNQNSNAGVDKITDVLVETPEVLDRCGSHQAAENFRQ